MIKKNEGDAPFFLNHEKKRKRKVSKLRSSVCLSVKKAFGVDSFIIKLYIIKLKAGDSLRVKKHTTHTSSEASENDDDSDDERRFLCPNQTTITSSRPSSFFSSASSSSDFPLSSLQTHTHTHYCYSIFSHARTRSDCSLTSAVPGSAEEKMLASLLLD